jgi:hypothetical protein
MRKQTHKLNNYEQEIINELQSIFGYNHIVAMSILMEYLPVLKKLGGYDNPRDHAESFHNARTRQFTCQQWLDHIAKMDEKPTKRNLVLHNVF